MKYKKVYVEITNRCQLSCSFCSKITREKKDMSPLEFEHIIKEISGLTDYIYLHVKGEPLISPYLQEILDISWRYNMKVNITTNGLNLFNLTPLLIKYDNIHQINISLHSMKENNLFNLLYYQNIFKSVDNIITCNKTFISYRLWDNDLRDNQDIYELIMKYYNLNINFKEYFKNNTNYKITKQVFLNVSKSFEWPKINGVSSNMGYCYGLSDHFAILVDGTVCSCCLDADGVNSLGNIFKSDIISILNSPKAIKIKKSLHNNKREIGLCKTCSFDIKRKKNN